jgi:hypothetical protein
MHVTSMGTRPAFFSTFAPVVTIILAAVVAGCGGDERKVEASDRMSLDSGTGAAAADCQVSGPGSDLPKDLKESSGLAQGRRNPGLFWSHNDAGNPPVLYGVSSDGSLGATVRIQGAKHDDWEDIAAGPCGGSSCLFVGDIGDNSGKRGTITIYRVEEPAAGDASATATPLEARYPDGPRDAEAMFMLSDDIYIVTKGREGPIELYRFPGAKNQKGTATLERLRELWPAPKSSNDRVTAASASPDGRWIGIRTYRRLSIFPASSLTGTSGAVPEPIVMDLSPLKEKGGEGLALANDGTVWLSSEAGGKKEPARMSQVKCVLPAPTS